MEWNLHLQTRSHWALTLVFSLAMGATITVPVLLFYGIGQFKVMDLVGQERALEVFALCYGSVSVAMIFLSPVQGIITDTSFAGHKKRRLWALLGSVFGSISLALFAHVNSIQWLFVFWLASVFFYGVCSSSLSALLADTLNKTGYSKSPAMLGITIPVVIMCISIAIFALLADSAIAIKLSALVVVQLTAIVTALLFIPSIILSAEHTQEVVPSQTKALFQRVQSYQHYRIVLLSKLLINLAISGTSVLSLFYVQRLALSQAMVFELNAMLSIGIVVLVGAGVLAIHYSEKYAKQKPFLILGASLFATAMLGYAFADNLVIIGVSSVLSQAGLGIIQAIGNALVYRSLPSNRHFARDIAIIDSTKHFSSSLIHFVAAAIVLVGVQLLGNDGYDFYFICLSVITLLYACVICFVQELPGKST